MNNKNASDMIQWKAKGIVAFSIDLTGLVYKFYPSVFDGEMRD